MRYLIPIWNCALAHELTVSYVALAMVNAWRDPNKFSFKEWAWTVAHMLANKNSTPPAPAAPPVVTP